MQARPIQPAVETAAAPSSRFPASPRPEARPEDLHPRTYPDGVASFSPLSNYRSQAYSAGMETVSTSIVSASRSNLEFPSGGRHKAGLIDGEMTATMLGELETK